ncbi:MAG: HlyD family type I secretion periplasmic adaptor subunit, partial [Sulfurovaceae bacterium]|nr:HlyD family type I secretion periplasmic adaptor subunit [Sulfurovaceae bacterium]
MSKEDKKVIPAKSAVGTIIFGLFTLFVVFGLIGGWMFYAPLASSSVAIGTVSADLEKKTVQHLEGGIVEEILVKDGDFVKKGDILLRLGNRKVKGNMEIEKQQYLEFLALETRLKAQRDEQRGIAFPSKLTSLEHKPKIRELLDGQRQVFRARERIVVSTKEITEEQISQLRRQKEGIQYSIDSKNLRLSSLNEELIEWEDLYAQQLIDKLKLRDVSREKIALEGDIASSESKLSEIDVRISELRATSIFREKEFQEKILSELVGVQAKLSTLKSTIFMAKDTMKKTVVKAPISGTIIEMEIHTIGGVVGSGTPLLKIVPKDSKLLVVAEVKTTDIDKVSV